MYSVESQPTCRIHRQGRRISRTDYMHYPVDHDVQTQNIQYNWDSKPRPIKDEKFMPPSTASQAAVPTRRCLTLFHPPPSHRQHTAYQSCSHFKIHRIPEAED
jgi:hypothetical protein